MNTNGFAAVKSRLRSRKLSELKRYNRVEENGAIGKSDIDGKAAMGSSERSGSLASFKPRIPRPRDG
jgi:hypothetical protein